MKVCGFGTITDRLLAAVLAHSIIIYQAGPQLRLPDTHSWKGPE